MGRATIAAAKSCLAALHGALKYAERLGRLCR